MSVFDLIVLAILAALTLRGIWKGMVSQIVSVASLFVCWIVASRFGGLVAPTIPVEAPWNQVLAMGIVFLITLVAIRFAHAALEKQIKEWKFEKLNTLLGGALGFVKGLLVCMIITFFAVMFSETSRDVAFNSATGNSLARLIAQIGVFVPKDSYEFVHTQLALFNDKVDQAVPGQEPKTVPVQSSEVVQQMFAQVGQAKEKTETVARAGSLLSALSQWWNGSKEEEPTAERSDLTTQTEQKNESLPAATYTSPPPPSQPVNIFTTVSPPVVSPAVSPSAPPEAFFIRSVESSSTPPVQPPTAQPPTAQPLTAFASPVPASTVPQVSAPLAALAPLSDLSLLPSDLELQLLPTLQTLHHVGSDQLLRNSTQSTPSTDSARLFRAR